MKSFGYGCEPDPMKALPALLSASLFLAAPLFAQEAPAPAPASAPESKPESAKGSEDAKPAPSAPAESPSAPAHPMQLAPSSVAPLLPAAPEPSAVPSTTLIPDTQTTFVKPPSMITKREKPSRTEDAENDLMQQIHFRQARTKAMADPTVVAAFNDIRGAGTDYEQRERTRKYYTLLFDRMAKIDNSYPTLLATARSTAMTRSTQTKLKPSERPEWLPPLPTTPAPVKKPASH